MAVIDVCVLVVLLWQGMNFDIGYISNGFVTDQGRNCAELEKPYVLVTNHAIATIRVRTGRAAGIQGGRAGVES